MTRIPLLSRTRTVLVWYVTAQYSPSRRSAQRSATGPSRGAAIVRCAVSPPSAAVTFARSATRPTWSHVSAASDSNSRARR